MARLMKKETLTEFDDAVSEYKTKEKETLKTFVHNIAECGAILHKWKEKMKHEQTWMKYCNEIGLTVAAANQQIRFYEHSRDAAKMRLLKGKINNWAKLNKYLSLADRYKEEFLNLDVDDDTPTKVFMEKIEEMKKGEDPSGDIKPVSGLEMVEATEKDELDLFTWIQEKTEDGITTNPKILAEFVQKELGLTINSREKLEGLIYIIKGIELFKRPATLDAHEKAALNVMLADQKKAVTELAI